MQANDFQAFRDLLTDVMAFYGKDVSPFSADVWWQALRRFSLDDARRAFSVHAQDPDRGQYPPRPADVIRLLDGGSGDRALQAWSKVDKAMRQVGPWYDVVFDDPIIHAVISDMGGWIAMGRVTDDEWPYRANEFRKRYQGYAMRDQVPAAYPRMLLGLANAHNEASGHEIQPPMLLGDPERARLVYERGRDSAGLPAILADDLRNPALPQSTGANNQHEVTA